MLLYLRPRLVTETGYKARGRAQGQTGPTERLGGTFALWGEGWGVSNNRYPLSFQPCRYEVHFFCLNKLENGAVKVSRGLICIYNLSSPN